MKKILILGGGKDQVPLIEEFNKRGYFTIIIDYLANPIGKSIANRHYQKSTLDIDAVREITKKEQPDILASISNDLVLPIIAEICSEFGIRNYIDPISIKKATNKSLMKKEFLLNNIGTPKIIEDFEYNNLPLIVKPNIGSSSRGVIKFDNPNEFNEYYNSIIRKKPENYIIEQYVEGDELSVDCIHTKDDVYVINVSKLVQVPDLNNKFTFLYIQAPYSCSDNLRSILQNTAEKIAKSFNITNAPFFYQAKVQNDNIYVIELGARIAGGNKLDFIKSISGVSMLSVFSDQLEGKTPKIEITKNKDIFIQLFIYAEKGVINRIIYKSEIDNLIVSELKKSGDVLTGQVTAAERVMSVMISAASIDIIQNKLDDFISSLQILDGDNNNLFNKDFYKTIKLSKN